MSEHYGRSLFGWAIGIPLAVAGFTSHWWVEALSAPKREWVQKQTLRWWPAAVLMAFVYVAVPSIYQRATDRQPAVVPTPGGIVGGPNTGNPQPSTGNPSLVVNPRIEWNGGVGPVTFHGQYTRTGEKLDVYVEWGALLGSPPVVGTFINWDGRRRAIDFKERFVRNAEIKTTVGAIRQAEGNQLIFRFGDSSNFEVGITQNSYVFRVVFVSQSGQEESYLFALISSKEATGPSSFSNLIIDPSLFLGRGNM